MERKRRRDGRIFSPIGHLYQLTSSDRKRENTSASIISLLLFHFFSFSSTECIERKKESGLLIVSLSRRLITLCQFLSPLGKNNRESRICLCTVPFINRPYSSEMEWIPALFSRAFVILIGIELSEKIRAGIMRDIAKEERKKKPLLTGVLPVSAIQFPPLPQ